MESVGLTAHFMTSDLDAGDVLTKLTVPLDLDAYPTLGALRNALSGAMPLMLVDAALGVTSGRLPRTVQPDAGRRYHVVHPRLRTIVARRLARECERAPPGGPSLVKRLVDAAVSDLDRT